MSASASVPNAAREAARTLGATVTPSGVRYRVWAPEATSVAVKVTEPESPPRVLTREADGHWSGEDPTGRAGDRYGYLLPDGGPWPDPASRSQPDGVDGLSEVVDAAAFDWRCADWERPSWTGQVIYELHVGTFTPAGTFAAAMEKLDYLRELGVELIELMPLGDFAGGRNWGYDGVDLFAPARSYGRPDDLRRLVDAAHQRGLGVIVDVVYNHLGPIGNYLGKYSADYFHHETDTPWGSALNFDRAGSGPVREFFLGNAAMWLDEYRVDGLRVDATHAIHDETEPHLLAELVELIHSRGAIAMAEDDRNTRAILRERDGTGHGFDAAWADDFHHQVRVALTGTTASYFGSQEGTAESLADTLEHGWRYRGARYPFWRGQPRGEPCRSLPTEAFIVCIENHDQVGNRHSGERLEHLVTPAAFRAATMLLLFSPYAPMLFMGQEWAAETPFLFFTDYPDHPPGRMLGYRVKEFRNAGVLVGEAELPDPQAEETFRRSKLDWGRRDERQLEFTRNCLALRRRDLPPAARARENWEVGVLGDMVALRYYRPDGDRLLLFANHACEAPAERPGWLKPGAGRKWQVLQASADADWGKWEWQFLEAGAVWLGEVAL